MKPNSSNRSHLGIFVRINVIPSGMTVTDAAKRLGISRPALSNFLNGRSALSMGMAVRLEKAFGADRKRMLAIQTEYDQQVRHVSEKGITVHSFVPKFLTIKANQIENWGEKIDARSYLSVLLRKLVHSTVDKIDMINFPGYDNAERHDIDGYVESSTSTPWVPYGQSYWEFSTSKTPDRKANLDYSARLKSLKHTEQANSTFIFVTTRNWANKTTWKNQKNETGKWKNVRAYDASDLEQWLEQSVPAQTWFAEQIGLPEKGYETIEQSWYRWANACEPHLTADLFKPAINAYKTQFVEWLTLPPHKPFVISADSSDEALAFISCLLNTEDLLQFKDLTAIIKSKETLAKLIASSVDFIPIVASQNVEMELIDAYRRLHCIVFHHRNVVNSNPDIVLCLPSHNNFVKALCALGFAKNEICRLEKESGRSPTILRRRLSKNAAIRTPAWAGDKNSAKALVPMALIGAWDYGQDEDRNILASIAGRSYESIENDICNLLLLDDCPVWSTGHFRGVISKTDALFAIASMITPGVLDRFFTAAQDVLSETDASSDPLENNSLSVGITGMTHRNSSALREGICETLIILSIYGDHLFWDRLGINTKEKVANLIHELLNPLFLKKLINQNNNLPFYAEAAPDEFLDMMDDCLNQDNTVFFDLLKPVDSGSIHISLARAGLLHSLDCLAWNPDNLPRVCNILAKLSKDKIDEKWANKPIDSLQRIFRSWMPQTTATVEVRVKVLKSLVSKCSDVAWEICIEQFKPSPRIGQNSYRPLWRSDASGAGQIATCKDRHHFEQEALRFMIDWPSHDEKTLGDLVKALCCIPKEKRIILWTLIDNWTLSATNSAKASLSEHIRPLAGPCLPSHIKIEKADHDRAREIYKKLLPQNLVSRHGWLFANVWVSISADDIKVEGNDLRNIEERVDRKRREAMNDLWAKYHFGGIKELLPTTNAPFIVGKYSMFCLTGIDERVQFIRSCLSLDKYLRNKAEWCLRGALSAIDDNLRTLVLKASVNEMHTEDRKRLFTNAPFRKSTWRLLDEYGSEIREIYWKNVNPYWDQQKPEEMDELIDRLLEVGRPHAAFHFFNFNIEDVETTRLKRLLYEVATVKAEPTDNLLFDRYQVSDALDSLGSRLGVSSNDIAKLELLFIDVLVDSKHGIPNLECIIADSPILYAKVVALAFKRSDKKDDPSELGGEYNKDEASVAAAYEILDQMKKIPGTGKNGKIDTSELKKWLYEVRHICNEQARTVIGDQFLGKLLARAPSDDDGSWPCKAVCEAMEEIGSPEISKGFIVEALNSRCTFWLGEGGQEQRDLAAKYRACTEHLFFDYPYVYGVLKQIANAYDQGAKFHDSQMNIKKRIRN